MLNPRIMFIAVIKQFELNLIILDSNYISYFRNVDKKLYTNIKIVTIYVKYIQCILTIQEGNIALRQYMVDFVL